MLATTSDKYALWLDIEVAVIAVVALVNFLMQHFKRG